MANETEQANIIAQTDVLADRASAALVRKIVVTPLIYAEEMSPTGTKVFPKEGSLTAGAVSESGSWSFGAGSEYTEGSLSLSQQKTMISVKLTREASRFTRADMMLMADRIGASIARDMEEDILALFDNFSGQDSSRTGTTLNVDALMDAAYQVKDNEAAPTGRRMVAVVDYKGSNEIKKELKDSGASAFGNVELVSALLGANPENGYVGNIPGIDVFETSGLPTSGSDDVALVFNPEMAFAAMYDSLVIESVFKGSEGVWDEITGYMFNAVGEWNDEAGYGVLSAT